ncbi:formamidopyrimidine-DNA glycosylase [Friedmanniella endophytica]|uniref:DNA-(apurinic or apyrimidinic site) lyase n=1 Tax=Microlunatus kandeliicorticis TaxID=1759536 RepID=A0A7W3IU31_9ACTN|nr:Fpg/Nei family DNA glycosylase [Microlunatus kandeliicorticis]MBA8795175.1 formamidopyrimidine-DNA glycosylase [Microlunatus kandeliicorticis]
MPEGDSVWLVARKLDVLVGRPLVRAELRRGKLAGVELVGRTVTEQATWGKHLLTRFDHGWTLHTHLKMDGGWTIVGPGKQLPRRMEPDVRVVLGVEGRTAYGLSLPVTDLVRTTEEDQVVGHLGPDPLRRDWDPAAAVARIGADPERPVNAALLDQRTMAGLGNLWVNELCFLRGVSPWTPVGEVDLPSLVALAARMLRHSATTPGAYQVTTGNNRRGREHWVAGRAHRACLRCGTMIEVRDQGDGGDDEEGRERRTWWCPHCQPGPVPASRTPRSPVR